MHTITGVLRSLYCEHISATSLSLMARAHLLCLRSGAATETLPVFSSELQGLTFARPCIGLGSPAPA